MKTIPVCILILSALVVYIYSNPNRNNFYNHFVWQANAFLKGEAAIPYPVKGNHYFQDIWRDPERPGYGLIPFPPLPALLLLPFAALWGMATNAALLAACLGALNVGLCARMLFLIVNEKAAILGTIFYGFGTVAWYASMLGSTWFFAHVAASTFLFLSITAAIMGKEGRAGLYLGTASLARLTTILGFPFFASFGIKRAFTAALGALIPLVGLISYNLAVTGHLFNPVYEYVHRNEYRPKGSVYHEDWNLMDIRYVPQNFKIMFGQLPEPSFKPNPIGMSLLLTSPAYLLALFAPLSRFVIGAWLSVIFIAFADLMHFSQGWVQFGYRFSNDFAPFALLLVGLGIERGLTSKVGSWLVYLLIAFSIIINGWGVYWGVVLGW